MNISGGNGNYLRKNAENVENVKNSHKTLPVVDNLAAMLYHLIRGVYRRRRTACFLFTCHFRGCALYWKAGNAHSMRVLPYAATLEGVIWRRLRAVRPFCAAFLYDMLYAYVRTYCWLLRMMGV